MVTIAYLIGIYSYLIFALGLFGLLYKQVIFGVSIIYIFLAIFWKWHSFKNVKYSVLPFYQKMQTGKKEKLIILFLFLFLIQMTVNVVGALAPELAFDALWYHLTLPKLYLLHHAIYYIPGGLLYYSAMPKLAELLYIPALAFSNEISANVIQFIFGILLSISLYQFSRKYFSPLISFLAVIVFYSNIVVAWESTTAYIDLGRTFFEFLSFVVFVRWWETGKKKWLLQSAILLGFAVTTKVLALGSLVIFLFLIFYRFWQQRKVNKELLYCILEYAVITLLIPLPWFIFSFIHTRNPVYPFFSPMYPVSGSTTLFNPIHFVTETWNMFLYSDDPISPLYLIFLPVIILFVPKFKKEIKVTLLYSILAIFVWYITPRTGGGRFILPYLPVFSFLVAACIGLLNKQKVARQCYIVSIILVIFVSVITILYRGVATKKYLPVVFGKEPQQQFLSSHLNFSYGDFYDTDNYFQTHIKPRDTVLLYGFHNLYYVNFPFIDSSWVKKGDRFNYIAVQNGKLPERFKDWKRVYVNKQTMVQLYSDGGKSWVY